MPFIVSTDSVLDGSQLILETDLLVSLNLQSCELDPLLMIIAPFKPYLYDSSLADGYLPASKHERLVFQPSINLTWITTTYFQIGI